LQKRTSVDKGDREAPIVISVKLFIVAVKGFDIAISFPPPGPVKTPNDFPPPPGTGLVI
jgi:hypothetical protein